MSKINIANLKKTLYYLKRNGFKDTLYAIRERTSNGYVEPYTYIEPSMDEQNIQRKHSLSENGFDFTISVVVPTYKTPQVYLRDLIDSMIAQTYNKWELVLADASGDESVKSVVDTYFDERIKYYALPTNEGISVNTNYGLEKATGEYIGLLDHDDVITKDALYLVADKILDANKKGIEPALIYSDEDKCNEDRTEYFEYHRKEEFNLDLLLSNNYICHFMVMRSDLIKLLKLRPDYDGAQDYDLVLRAASMLKDTPSGICHIDKTLYHWRCHGASTAENPASKEYAYEAGRRALQDYADREGIKAKVRHLKHLGFYTLDYLSDVFSSRDDVAAVGGPVYKDGALVSGRLSDEGYVFYEGIKKGFSGYMHRVFLTQDVYALDIRNIRVSSTYYKLFEEVTKVSYKEKTPGGIFDYSLLPEGTDYIMISMKLGESLREKGKRLLYMPDMARDSEEDIWQK